MATTEQRTGFRLPWSSEDKAAGKQPTEAHGDRTDDQGVGASSPVTGGPTAVVPGADANAPVDPQAAAHDPADEPASRSAWLSPAAPAAPSTYAPMIEGAPVQPTASPVAPSRPAAAPRKPTKFLADLTRAMQAAAESSRAATMEQFQADAKTYIEQVQVRSGEEATEIRREADDDIVGIREWSKAELARIREETERKISTRRADLEAELEAHAARIEREVDGVQARITGFETEMGRFFERLLLEDDPAEFAAMAENLPEPPPFDGEDMVFAATAVPTETAVVMATSPARSQTAEVPEADATVEHEDASATAVDETPDAPDVPDVPDVRDESTPEPEYAVQDDPAAIEAAMAAIEAAYHAAGETEATTAGPEDDDHAAEPARDPRLAVLGLTPDLGEAEAEAAASAADQSDDDEIPTLDDDALAARLAGLVPPADPSASIGRTPAAPAGASTRVVVTGLISVASIASFKRHLGRVEGVQSVGVSSGPDGEFVFNVSHAPEVALADVVPTLSGFEARVTGHEDGVVTVSARDPESEA